MEKVGLMSQEGSSPRRGDDAARPRRRPGDKPFVPFSRFEDIVVKCGHVVKFGLLPEGKDRFREARRQKALSRDCKECRAKRQQQELEAAQRRKAEKEKRKMQPSEQPHRAEKPKSRLPDGSRFEVQYDAAKQQWSGTLTVPAAGQGATSFTGARSSLFKLLAVLDDQYRSSLSGT
jgi:hypothetical protein